MKKLIIFSIVLFAFFGLLTKKANADCQSVYGGGQTCTYNFTISKSVQVPGKGGGQYVHNLGTSDALYTPSQSVNYQIVVTNTGSNNIPSLNVVDTFPQYVTFVSGVGNYNSSNNTLNFTVTNLNPGQSLTYVITAQIASNIPSTSGPFCVINQVTATDTNGQTQSDSSQLCIQQPTATPSPTVAPVPSIKTTPPTGPEMLPLLGLLPGALGGMLLRKKSKQLTKEGGEK